MNFIKTFLLSLLVYLGLNLVFALIIVFSSPLASVPDAAVLIISLMFGPITTSPAVAWVDQGIISLIQTTDPLTDIMMFLYYVVPPILTVIISGIIADSTTIAFLSWLLIALISIVVYVIIIGVVGSSPTSTLYFLVYVNLWFLYGPTDLYIAMILFGLLNIFLYGCISFLVTRKKL
ncbi:MAG: hypothetical protein ACXACC_09325 [Promethearchaeota archaeon]|jgi:hypothetical protein